MNNEDLSSFWNYFNFFLHLLKGFIEEFINNLGRITPFVFALFACLGDYCDRHYFPDFFLSLYYLHIGMLLTFLLLSYPPSF